MHVVITGGTGLIGCALTQALIKRGYNVSILTTSAIKERTFSDSIQYAQWDTRKMIIDTEVISKADYIIHLAGANIASQRWSQKYKDQIRNSRINSSNLLAHAVNEYGSKVKCLISASAIGWYGEDRDNHTFTEEDEAAKDFLGTTCLDWETAIQQTKVCPVACIRTGIVLTKAGGAIPQLTQTLRYGICAFLGNGRQIMSWIHLDDLIRIYITAMENQWSGSFNAVAPVPLSQRELSLNLATAKRGKFFSSIYVPGFLLKIIKGEGISEALKSTTVSCRKIKEMGFTFQYPSITSCVSTLI